MKKRNLNGFASVILIFSGISHLAFAQVRFAHQSIESSAACVVPKVDGERVPFPLQKANTKFELSENETYLLNGTLVSMNNKTYLKVDFNSQPWLATQKLVQFPYFEIASVNLATVNQMNGRLVQVAVVARRSADTSLEGGNELKLNSILPPAKF